VDDTVRRARSFVEAHLAEPVDATAVARAVCRSRRHLDRLFKQAYGCSIHEYVSQQRMRLAAGLLRDGAKVEAVVVSIGLTNRTNFYRQFTRTYGRTPGDCRRSKPV
jgi:transcriptional regulator GlxA family with amidase domain